MGFFTRKVHEEETPKEKHTPYIKKSAYIHDYRPWSKEHNLTIDADNGDKYAIEIDSKYNTPKETKPIYDYDFLIFDSASELDETQAKELRKAVEIKIPIVILTGPYHTKAVHSEALNNKKCSFFEAINNDYFKFKYDFVSGPGRDADIKNNIFKLWWEFIKIYHITFDNLPPNSKILAFNKPKIPIAWNYNNFIFIPGDKEKDIINGYGINNEYQEFYTARRMKYFSELIKFALAFRPESKLPEWFNNYRILNEAELLTEREQINKKIEELTETKKVIATDDLTLEDTLGKMLSKLKIKLEKIGSEDFLIKGNPNIVLEITGTKHNLDSKKAIQSLQHQERLSGRIEGDLKLCVIINHQKEIIPDKRNKLDHYTIKEYYEKHNICVVSTITLLKYYDKIVNGRMTKEEFLQKISSTIGELE